MIQDQFEFVFKPIIMRIRNTIYLTTGFLLIGFFVYHFDNNPEGISILLALIFAALSAIPREKMELDMLQVVHTKSYLWGLHKIVINSNTHDIANIQRFDPNHPILEVYYFAHIFYLPKTSMGTL